MLKEIRKSKVDDDIGVIDAELNFREEAFRKRIEIEDTNEKNIKCELLDIPNIYHYLDP